MAIQQNHILDDAIKHWEHVAPAVAPPTNEQEYDAMVERLDKLLDIVKDDETHHLMSLVDVLSEGIAAYDAAHYEMPKVRGTEALEYLIQEHGLKQSDLPEIGSQGVVSEVLSGKRKLNVRQIMALADRFNVSELTFINGAEDLSG